MASYILTANNPINIDPVEDFSESGWSVSGGIAFHEECNAGTIDYVMDLSVHAQWTFEYEILSVLTGGINIIVNGVNGIFRTAPGKYKETFAITNASAPVLFYSNGTNSIKDMKAYPATGLDNARTFVFNEEVNKFGGDKSYHPEFMHKFIDDMFFSFKNGRIWEHDVNPVHMNFYGEQFTAKIKFVANDRNQFNKLWMGIKIHSNGRWSVPEMITLPNETYPNGMKSRLHENNFSVEAGKYWGDIMRDMLDPQFPSQLQALFEGRVMEGDILIMEIETKVTTDIKLQGLYLYSSDQDRNF